MMSAQSYASKSREFFAWWIIELAGMLPAANTLASKSSHRGLTISLEGGHCQLSWDDGRKTEDLGKNFVSDLAIEKYKNMVSHDPKLAVNSCVVQLPTKKILRRVIELPESTEENLGNVVSYEMDRYTPFDKEDVYFDVKIKNRNKQEGKITVNLNVVKKKLLDDLIQGCLKTTGFTLNHYDFKIV